MNINKPALIQFPATQILGLKTPLSSSMSKNASLIAAHWKKFNAQLHSVKGYRVKTNEWRKFGITFREDEILYYMCAVQKLEGMVSKTMETNEIPEGPYLKFEHRGAVRYLPNTVQWIFREYLPAEMIQLRVDPEFSISMIESYDKRFHWSRNNSVLDIYVPVKEKYAQELQ